MKSIDLNSTSIQVTEYAVLDKLINDYPCFTREGVSEVIIDIAALDEERVTKLEGEFGMDFSLKEVVHFWK